MSDEVPSAQGAAPEHVCSAPRAPDAEFLRIVLDNIHEEISILDRDRNVIYVNRVFFERHESGPGEFVGHKCFEALRSRPTRCDQCICVHSFADDLAGSPPGSDGPGLDCHRARVLVTGVPVEQCGEEDTADGKRCVERRTFPIRDTDGRIGCVIHCVRDVTEQREMEKTLRRQREQLGRMLREVRRVRDQNDSLNAQLMQAEKLASLGEMASIMAHELDSPLSTILGYAEMLKAIAPDETCRKRLGVISEQAGRCHEIIRRTLDFARKPGTAPGPVDLNGVVRQVSVLLEHAMQKRHVRLVQDLSDPLPAFQGDHHAMTQVCFNLMKNALDAVKAGGEIIVRTAAEDGCVVMEVLDDGCGLPQAGADRIFEPFFTTKPPGQGTGLGLPICRSIVHAQGGRITAANRGGGGARFRVEVPLDRA